MSFTLRRLQSIKRLILRCACVIAFSLRIALGAEGFYEPGVVPTSFDQKLFQAATPVVGYGDQLGTGVFISAEGELLTNWHVVRPCIEENLDSGKLNLEKGYFSIDGVGLPCSGISVYLKTDHGWQHSEAVRLLAFPKQSKKVAKTRLRDSTQNVLDFVLLKVDLKPTFWITKTVKVMPELGTLLVALGHPAVSWRGMHPRGAYGDYKNANGQYRVSVGKMFKAGWFFKRRYPDLFISDIDSRPGNSGGPILTWDGALVGLISRGGEENSYEYQGDGIWSESIIAIQTGLCLTETCGRCFQE